MTAMVLPPIEPADKREILDRLRRLEDRLGAVRDVTVATTIALELDHREVQRRLARLELEAAIRQGRHR